MLLISLNWAIFAQKDTALIKLKPTEIKLNSDFTTYERNKFNTDKQ